jgi:hypothetical protein
MRYALTTGINYMTLPEDPDAEEQHSSLGQDSYTGY